MRLTPAFSTPAFSTPMYRIFHSRIFSPTKLTPDLTVIYGHQHHCHARRFHTVLY